tara:strand:+ start:97 stop:255 length:159 start_codon:yes stop_codon:yes gene_type:complete
MEIKPVIDGVAIVGGVGSWLSLLPDIAAVFTIVWLSIRIWESKTVREWRKRD